MDNTILKTLVQRFQRTDKEKIRLEFDAPIQREIARRLEIIPYQWGKVPRQWRWIKQTIVHLDFTPDAINFTVFKKYHRKFIPQSLAVLPRGSGDDLKAVQTFIQENLAKLSLVEPRIWVTLQHPALQIAEIQIPKVADEIDVTTAIPLQLKSEIPEFEEERYLWQYIQNGIIEIEGLPYYHFFVVYFPKDLFEQFLKQFETLQIKPEFFLPRPFILLNGINCVVQNLDRALIVELGQCTSTFIAYQDGHPVKMMTVPLGAKTFSTEGEKPSIKFEESNGIADAKIKSRLDSIIKETVTKSPKPYRALIAEVRKMQYWLQRDYHWHDWQTILVNFQQKEDVLLLHALQSNFNVPVLPLVASEAPEETLSRLLPLVGLPEYVQRNPDLVPRNVIWEERLVKVNLGIALALLLTFAGFTAFQFQQQRTIHALKSEIAQLQSTVIQLGEKNETIKNLLIQKSVFSKAINELQQKLSVPPLLENYLYVVTQSIPRGLYLSEILIDDAQNPVFMEYQSLVSNQRWQSGILIKGYSLLPAIAAETRLLFYIEQLKKQMPVKQLVPVYRNFNVTNKRYEFTLFVVIQ